MWRTAQMDKTETASPSYRHKEGRCTCTGGRRSRRSSPNRGRAVAEYYRKYTVPHWRVRRRACSRPGVVLGPAEIAPASLWLLQAAWRLLWRVRPLGVAWQHSEGLACRGLDLVKAPAAPEGRAHAARGACSEESTREVQGVGSTMAGTTPRTFAQCIAGSHSGATAPGMAV